MTRLVTCRLNIPLAVEFGSFDVNPAARCFLVVRIQARELALEVALVKLLDNVLHQENEVAILASLLVFLIALRDVEYLDDFAQRTAQHSRKVLAVLVRLTQVAP